MAVTQQRAHLAQDLVVLESGGGLQYLWDVFQVGLVPVEIREVLKPGKVVSDFRPEAGKSSEFLRVREIFAIGRFPDGTLPELRFGLQVGNDLEIAAFLADVVEISVLLDAPVIVVSGSDGVAETSNGLVVSPEQRITAGE